MLNTPEQQMQFATLMTSLSDYYGKEISDGVIDIYWNSLRGYEYADIRKAAWAHVQNPETAGSFLPKVSEFVKMMQGSTTDQSAIAWSKLDKAVRQVGPYHDIAFDDPIIHRVVADMGGWVHMCSHDDNGWPFVGNEFKTRYKGYRMRGETPEYPPLLSGITNASNDQQHVGMRFLPILVGDETKCKAVMQSGSITPLIQMRTASEAANLMIGK